MKSSDQELCEVHEKDIKQYCTQHDIFAEALERALSAREEEVRKDNVERDLYLGWARRLPPRLRGAQFRNLTVDDASRQVIKEAKKYSKQLFEQNPPPPLGQESVWTGPNLILTGGVGTGKTTIAWAVMFDLLERLFQESVLTVGMRTWRVEAYTVTDLENAFRMLYSNDSIVTRRMPMSSFDDQWLGPSGGCESVAEAIKYFVKRDILILDDLGVATPGKDFEKILCAILDGRYLQCRPTIITSNHNLSKAADLGFLGTREVSRLAGSAVQLKFGGTDRRVDSATALKSCALELATRPQDPYRLGKILQDQIDSDAYRARRRSSWDAGGGEPDLSAEE